MSNLGTKDGFKDFKIEPYFKHSAEIISSENQVSNAAINVSFQMDLRTLSNQPSSPHEGSPSPA